MTTTSYAEDNRLDILILGPMDNDKKEDPASARIRSALAEILTEQASLNYLQQKRVGAWRVHIPEEWRDSGIINGVLSRLDIADLVILNLTPKNGIPSPNVYYELGLVHALGLPYILLFEKGVSLPFYMMNLRAYEISEFSVDILKEELRDPIQVFLRDDGESNFADNHITQFYDGMPILDISAAVGLATGYYHNFVGRILREGSFVSAYPDKVKHLIIVRPINVQDTYEQDMELLQNRLTERGIVLGKAEQLPEPPGDRKGPIWIYQVNGIVIDLPRTIYPLKISPRLLTMQERFDKPGKGNQMRGQSEILMRQAGERLLDRVEHAIRYHVNKERNSYRKNSLHFARIDEVADLIAKLSS